MAYIDEELKRLSALRAMHNQPGQMLPRPIVRSQGGQEQMPDTTAEDVTGSLAGTAAAIGTAFIPGIGPVIAPLVGAAVGEGVRAGGKALSGAYAQERRVADQQGTDFSPGSDVARGLAGGLSGSLQQYGQQQAGLQRADLARTERRAEQDAFLERMNEQRRSTRGQQQPTGPADVSQLGVSNLGETAEQRFEREQGSGMYTDAGKLKPGSPLVRRQTYGRTPEQQAASPGFKSQVAMNAGAAPMQEFGAGPGGGMPQDLGPQTIQQMDAALAGGQVPPHMVQEFTTRLEELRRLYGGGSRYA